jgi:hypothetical protein
MQTDLIRTEIEHYKIKLRAGERGPLLGPRQTGRTTAIMEYAHELVHAGYRVIIVCFNSNAAEHGMRDYALRFPGHNDNPVVFVYDDDIALHRVLCGQSSIVLYDTY